MRPEARFLRGVKRGRWQTPHHLPAGAKGFQSVNQSCRKITAPFCKATKERPQSVHRQLPPHTNVTSRTLAFEGGGGGGPAIRGRQPERFWCKQPCCLGAAPPGPCRRCPTSGPGGAGGEFIFSPIPEGLGQPAPGGC